MEQGNSTVAAHNVAPIASCSASLAALQGSSGRNRCRIGGSEGRSGVTFGEGAMTVAELIEMLSALPDKTARVVKSPGPWDGLNEPGLIHDGYVDKDLQFPVQATEPDAIHVVFL
jgi:hypothetical protein